MIENITAAVVIATAKAMQLTPIHRLLTVTEPSPFAAVLLDGAGTRLPWEKCGKLTRREAHEAVDSLDAPRSTIDFFHKQIDGVPCRVDEAPAFHDFVSEGGAR